MVGPLVIVGASLAGLRAAQAARRAGHDGGLVVIGAEDRLPYNRPPLSKELLHGSQTPERCAFPLGELDLEWRLGVPAVGLDRDEHTVVLADGTDISYRRLIVATGCRARRWPGAGAELAGVHTLRDLDDAVALRADLVPGRRLVIVGAGFIGCEVAASARGLGLDVTLVDIAAYPMVPLGPELGQRWLAMHEAHGVDLRLGVGIAALHGDARVAEVELSDGSRLDADVVLIALGSQLNQEWLEGTGLELNPAVVTDATLTSTVDPDVLAAGDIAACPVALADGQVTRIEHWTTAAEHGQLAGRNALLEPDERAEHTAVPYFWSDQYDIKIQALGCPSRGEHSELLEQSEDCERMVMARVRDGQVVGVVAIGAAKRLVWYRKQLTRPLAQAEIEARLAADAGVLV